MTIKDTIAHLDELKWPKTWGVYCYSDKEKYHYFHDEDGKATFVIHLLNSYDTLRRAALAGAALAEAVGEMWPEVSPPEDGSDYELGWLRANSHWRTQRDAALDTYKKSV